MKNHSFLVFLILFCTFRSYARSDSHLEHIHQLIEHGHYAKAEQALADTLRQNGSDHLAHCYLGRVYLIREDPDRAMAHFEKAVELQPENADYHLHLGQACGQKVMQSGIFGRMKYAKRTRNAFENAVKLDSTHIPSRIALTQYYTHAPGILGGGMEKAEVQARAVMKMDEIQGRYLRSQILEKQGRLEAAMAEMDSLESITPDSSKYAFVYQHYGYFLISQDQPESAVEKFKKMIALQPENANAYDCLGDAYRAMGDLEKAAEAYRRALEVNPNFKYSKEKLEEITSD